MNIMNKLAVRIANWLDAARPKNVTYDESVYESFGAVPGAAGYSVFVVR